MSLSPISVTIFKNQQTATRLENSNGYNNHRFYINHPSLGDRKLYSIAFSGTIYKENPKETCWDKFLKCFGIRRFVVLQVKDVESNEILYLRVNRQSLLKRLGMNTKESKKFLPKSNDYTKLVHGKLEMLTQEKESQDKPSSDSSSDPSSNQGKDNKSPIPLSSTENTPTHTSSSPREPSPEKTNLNSNPTPSIKPAPPTTKTLSTPTSPTPGKSTSTSPTPQKEKKHSAPSPYRGQQLIIVETPLTPGVATRIERQPPKEKDKQKEADAHPSQASSKEEATQKEPTLENDSTKKAEPANSEKDTTPKSEVELTTKETNKEEASNVDKDKTKEPPKVATSEGEKEKTSTTKTETPAAPVEPKKTVVIPQQKTMAAKFTGYLGRLEIGKFEGEIQYSSFDQLTRSQQIRVSKGKDYRTYSPTELTLIPSFAKDTFLKVSCLKKKGPEIETCFSDLTLEMFYSKLMTDRISLINSEGQLMVVKRDSVFISPKEHPKDFYSTKADEQLYLEIRKHAEWDEYSFWVQEGKIIIRGVVQDQRTGEAIKVAVQAMAGVKAVKTNFKFDAKKPATNNNQNSSNKT